AATGTVTMSIASGAGAVTIPAGSKVSTAPQAGQAPVIFETDIALVIPDTAPHQADVTVTQGQTISNEALGQSDGSLDQVFVLFSSPVIDGSQDIMVDEGLGAVTWIFYSNLIDAGPTDNAYTTFTDENGSLN